MEIDIREARRADAEAIAEIYNYAIAETIAVWHDDPVDAANRELWISEHQAQGFPVLVAESAGRVVGFAAYGRFRDFHGYRHTVEHSVYVHPAAFHQGIGRHLLVALIHEARERGIHVMVAAIEAGNTASIALHRECGFEDVGTLREVGWKFGAWRDLTFLTLRCDRAR